MAHDMVILDQHAEQEDTYTRIQNFKDAALTKYRSAKAPAKNYSISSQFHPIIPSAIVNGPVVDPVMTDTLRPMIPESPTPKSSLCGRLMVAASLCSREKE